MGEGKECVIGTVERSDIELTADLSHDGVWGGADILAAMFCDSTLGKAVVSGASLPPPSKLFGNLWLEEQTSVLFADNGVGKSILAIQIAQSIATGIPINGFEMTAPPQKVLYFDFEMSERQLAMRYSDDNHNIHIFSDNLIRCTFNRELNIQIGGDKIDINEAGDNMTHLMLMAMESVVQRNSARVVVIDNLSAVCRQSAEADQALAFMSELDTIKKRNKLSILILAHTPKVEPWMPITKNDLGGSKHISNFVDSIFGMGKCKGDNSQRYIKQVKARDTAEQFTENNVAVLELTKNNSMLAFTFINTNTEHNVLIGMKTYTQGQREEYSKICKQNINRNKPYTHNELLELLIKSDNKKGTDRQKNDRARKKLHRSKYIEKEGDVYYIDSNALFK